MTQCAVCEEFFSGTTMFDLHRVGPHDGDRRCLTVGEMREKGWETNAKGEWSDPARVEMARKAFADVAGAPRRAREA